jgi:hypothetical protein
MTSWDERSRRIWSSVGVAIRYKPHSLMEEEKEKETWRDPEYEMSAVIYLFVR